MAEIKKWGFGAAPYKADILCKNRTALECVLRYVANQQIIADTDICHEISLVKGLFNRILRQDQWDWFTTYMYFDFPRIGECSKIINSLSALRIAIKSNQNKEIPRISMQITKTNFVKYANKFLEFNINEKDTDEYIYILSRKEEKNLLKIGMTTRNVLKRCQEINAATGVVFPISLRKVFRVINSKEAEYKVHQALAEYRVRPDREFFIIDYLNACKIIEKCLQENELF